MTGLEARRYLDDCWGRRIWHGQIRVEIVHGNGHVLRPIVRTWCDEKGISWSTIPQNYGVTVIHPGHLLHRPIRSNPKGLTGLAAIKNELPKHSPAKKTDVEGPNSTGLMKEDAAEEFEQYMRSLGDIDRKTLREFKG